MVLLTTHYIQELLLRCEVRTNDLELVLHLNILSNTSLLWTVRTVSINKNIVQKISVFKKTTVVAIFTLDGTDLKNILNDIKS